MSVAGIAGYLSAMNKYRANEVIYEANKRAILIMPKLHEGGALSLAEFTLQNTTAGGVFRPEVVDLDESNQFAFEVSNMPKSVCENILDAIGGNTPIRKLLLESDLETPLESCPDGDNTYLLVYNKNMTAVDFTPSEDESNPYIDNNIDNKEDCEANEKKWCPGANGTGACFNVSDCCAGVTVTTCQKCLSTGEVVDKIMTATCDSNGDGTEDGMCAPYTLAGTYCPNGDECASGQECIEGICAIPTETVQCLAVPCSAIDQCCALQDTNILLELAQQYLDSNNLAMARSVADQANMEQCNTCSTMTGARTPVSDGKGCYFADVDYYIEHQDFRPGYCKSGRCTTAAAECGGSLSPCQTCNVSTGLVVEKLMYDTCDADGDGVAEGSCAPYTLTGARCSDSGDCNSDETCLYGYCAASSPTMQCLPASCAMLETCCQYDDSGAVEDSYLDAISHGDYTMALKYAEILNGMACSWCDSSTGERIPHDSDGYYVGWSCRYFDTTYHGTQNGSLGASKLGVCQAGKCVPAACDGVISYDGRCYPCNSPEQIEVEDIGAYRCQTNCPERKLVNTDHDGGGICVLNCAAVGAFELTNGECEYCNVVGEYTPASADDCVNTCQNTATPRKMKNGKCVLADETCPSGTFKGGNGFCKPCNVKTADDTWLEENPGSGVWYLMSSESECQSCVDEGTRYYDGSMCRYKNPNTVCSGGTCVCAEGYYGNGITCTACPNGTTAPAGSTSSSACVAACSGFLDANGNCCLYGNSSEACCNALRDREGPSSRVWSCGGCMLAANEPNDCGPCQAGNEGETTCSGDKAYRCHNKIWEDNGPCAPDP